MRTSLFFGLVVLGLSGLVQAQEVAAPSAQVQPALDGVTASFRNLRLDKWKGGTVLEESAGNVKSVLDDVSATLPPLLAVADAAPARVSAVLPVLRNLDALYDVALRVEEAARVAGTREQVADLEGALTGLQAARRGLGDRVQAAALAGEARVVELQGKVAVVGAPVAPCPPVAPKGKKKAKAAAASPK